MMTVLITGASSGIGAGLAKSFAADGHLVIACGRDASRTAALQQLSPNISVRLFDMTDRDACRQALTGCFADLIILCAGTCEYLDHGQVDAALVERVMATNFLGPVNCRQRCRRSWRQAIGWCWSAPWRTGCPSRARKPMAPPRRR